MSALPPKADMCSALGHVCFGPTADIRTDENCLSGSLDTHIDFAAKRPKIDWFGEECLGAVLQGLLLSVRIAIGGDHDDRNVGSKGFCLRQQLQTSHSRHVDV